MPHSLIVGMTESGKTTLATEMSREYQQAGIKVIVLDALRDPRWHCDFITSDRMEFLYIARHPETRRCAVFVDEAGEAVGRYEEQMFWLATRGRHYGHNCHFVTQRAAQLSPTVRTQCGYLYLFNCSIIDAKTLADEWNRPQIKDANTLAKGEYFKVPRWGDVEKLQIFRPAA